MAQFNWECIWCLTSSENIAGGPSLMECTIMGHAKFDIHRKCFYHGTSFTKRETFKPQGWNLNFTQDLLKKKFEQKIIKFWDKQGFV